MPELYELRLHWVDTLIIVAYLCLLLAIGVYHARRQRNLADYFLAGQEMRWAAVGMSLLAALNSGLDFLMQPSAMIKFGACILVANLTWLLLLPYVCLVTVPMYRRLGALSAYEYLERRFDVRVRTMAAGIFILWRLGWMAVALYVPSLAISTATGGRISVTSLTLIIGLVITTYTMLGGIRAVIWNDVLQYCIMFLGLAVTIWIAVSATDGGFLTILAQLPQVGEAEGLEAPAGSPAGWLSFFYIPMTATGFFVAILVTRLGTYTSDQVMVQRIQTARSVVDARRGFVIAAVSDVIWMVSLCFLGLALFAYFIAQEGSLPSWVGSHPDQVFPYFIAHVFPVGLTGLVIAAILAASISSVDSALNSLTSVMMIDFVERLYFGRRRLIEAGDAAGQRKQVIQSRCITLAVGLLGIAISLQVSRLGSLLEISNKIINSFAGPILGIYLLGMFTQRASSLGVLIGGALGTAVTVFVAFQAELNALANSLIGTDFSTSAVISFLWPTTFGLLVTFVCGYLASLITATSDRKSGQEWVWTSIMRTPSL